MTMLSPVCVRDLDAYDSRPLRENVDKNLNSCPHFPGRHQSTPHQCVWNPEKQLASVRFVVDENDAIISEEIPFHYFAGEDDDWQTKWLSDKEMKATQLSAVCVADFCLDCRPEYAATALALLAQCASSDSNLPTESIIQFINGSARGLEQLIVPMLHKRRSTTVKAALASQRRLQKLPADQRWFLIAQQYNRNTRYARTWSQLVACGDAKLCGE